MAANGTHHRPLQGVKRTTTAAADEGVSARAFMQEFLFNSSLQMYIIYIHIASNGARTHSGISYHMFQVCNNDFDTIRTKHHGVKSLMLHHISFILRESSKCKENGPGRTSVCFGEELFVLIPEAVMTPRAFSKGLVRTENGTDLYGRVIEREKRENEHSVRASYAEVLAEASF